MARGYLPSGQWIAERENSSRNAQRRRSYRLLNDQFLAETTAIRAEKKLNSKRGKYAITGLFPVIGWTEFAFELFQGVAKRLPIRYE
jgi:hypothetical protein